MHGQVKGQNLIKPITKVILRYFNKNHLKKAKSLNLIMKNLQMIKPKLNPKSSFLKELSLKDLDTLRLSRIQQ